MPKKSTRSHLEERRTHSYLIGTNSGTFDSFEQALKAADSLKNALVRKCKAMDYHCIALIGVSRHTNDHGVIKPNKFGKCEYEPYIPNLFPDSECERPPHLHILLIANPASTLKNFIVDYFQKNHSPCKTKVTWEKKADTYGNEAVRYVSCCIRAAPPLRRFRPLSARAIAALTWASISTSSRRIISWQISGTRASGFALLWRAGAIGTNALSATCDCRTSVRSACRRRGR